MKKVLLTGISGYIGLHCAVELLKQGYAVKGSVRDLSKTADVTRGIQNVVDTTGKLEYCELNLLQDEGWDKAMEGCDYVLHVASPFFSSQPKDENELIRPAVEGTQRAIKAAKKAGIKRVVLTSSIVAMIGGAQGEVTINQESWTDVDGKYVSAYIKSKTLAEKSAWDLINNQQGDEDKLELVTIHPGPVYGPPLNGNISGESMSVFKDVITGKMPLLPQAAISMSDVRDIATIHVQALENKQANGQRFIVTTEHAYSFKEMAQILKSNGYEKVSTKEAPNFLLKLIAKFSRDAEGLLPYVGNTFTGDVQDTMRVFNWKPIAFNKTILDTGASIKDAMKNNR